VTLAFDDHKKAEEKYQPTDTLATFLRLAVSNAPGKETARDVEIIVLEIEEFAISPAGSGGRSIWLANPALGWTHAFDSELRYQLPRTSIPPGATRYVDVGRWLRLADASADLSFVLSVIPEPATLRHVLPPGGWRLRLSATLQNGDATFWDAKISYGFMFSAGIAQLIDVKATVVKVASASAPAASG